MASLQNDEEAIRQLVPTWMEANKTNDLLEVLSLMAESAHQKLLTDNNENATEELGSPQSYALAVGGRFCI